MPDPDAISQSFACYVINLDGSTDRMAAIAQHMAATQVQYERQPAVDGRAFTPADVPEYDEAAALRYMGRKLVGGELGCYLSHLEAAEQLLRTDKDACLVLEDDAEPPPDLGDLVEQTCAYLSAADPNWRVVNLGNPRQKIVRRMSEFSVGGKGYTLVRAFYFPMTTTAILWSRKGAEDFVQGHGRIFAPVDNFLRHWITRAGGGYAFDPRPVSTLEAESEIGSNHAVRRAKHGRTLAYGWRKQRRLFTDKAIALLKKNAFSGE